MEVEQRTKAWIDSQESSVQEQKTQEQRSQAKLQETLVKVKLDQEEREGRLKSVEEELMAQTE